METDLPKSEDLPLPYFDDESRKEMKNVQFLDSLGRGLT